MKRWLLSLLLLIPCIAKAQSNVAGLLYASNFATWTVPQGNVGQMSWSAPSFCTVTSGGTTFRAFSVGTPVMLVDAEVPANSEVITPIQATYTGFSCSISAAATHPHRSFYFTSATAGLGEALSFAGTQPYQIILTPDWQRLGGLTGMITAAKGSTAVTISDQRTSQIVPYSWSGSAYVAGSFGGGSPGTPNYAVQYNLNNAFTGLAANTQPTAEVVVSQGGGTSSPTVKTCANQVSGDGNTITCTWSSAPQAGEFVVVGAQNYYTPATMTVTDSAGNTYTPVAPQHAAPQLTTLQTQLFYFGPLAAPITTTTLNATNGSTLTIEGNTFTGVTTSSPVDGYCYADTTASTSISCGTAITTTIANDYVFCDAHNATVGDAFSAGSGFTAGASFNVNNYAQYKVQSAIGALTPSITSTGANPATMNCAAFKPGGSALAPVLSNSPGLNTINMTVQNKIINGTIQTCHYTQATVDLRVAAATADAIALSNGSNTRIVDASCETGNQSYPNSVVLGDSANDPVAYILPCGVYWTYTGTGAPILTWYGGATVETHCGSSANQIQFTDSSGSDPTYGIQMIGSGGYVRGQGIQLSLTGGGSHATSSGVGLYIDGQFADGSELDNVNVYDTLDAQPELVYGACCRFHQHDSSINAGWVGTPLTILTDSGNYTRDFEYTDGTIVHPGTGLPAVYCHDTRNSTVSSFTARGVYTETGNTGVAAPIYKIDGCSRATIEDVTFPQYGTANFTGVQVTNAYNSYISVNNMWFVSGTLGWSLPAKAIENDYTGEPDAFTDGTYGYFEHYSPPVVPSYFGIVTFGNGINLASQNQINYMEGFSSGSGANQGAFNLSYYNPTAATSGQNLNGPTNSTAAFYWNGSASAIGYAQSQLTYGSGANPTQTYAFTHGGSSGAFSYSFDGPVRQATLYSAAGTPLPSCASALKGAQLTVSDATSPTFLGTYTSGGTVNSPVMCNGTNWVTY